VYKIFLYNKPGVARV